MTEEHASCHPQFCNWSHDLSWCLWVASSTAHSAFPHPQQEPQQVLGFYFCFYVLFYFFFFFKKWPIPSFLKVLRPLSSWVNWVVVPSWLNFCLRVTVAVLKSHNQSTLRIKGFIWLNISWIKVYWKKSRQELNSGGNLEKGADAESMEECCLLPCFSACFLILPRTTAKSDTTSITN